MAVERERIACESAKELIAKENDFLRKARKEFEEERKTLVKDL